MEEAAEKASHPLLDCFVVTGPLANIFIFIVLEGLLRQQEDLFRTGTETERMIEEKVIQFVGANEILGLLFNLSRTYDQARDGLAVR